MRIRVPFTILTLMALLVLSATATSGWADEIVIGGTCDRTGATKNIGAGVCPGILDYAKLINKKGGINGNPLRWIEVEHAYKVDRGVEGYERIKRDGGVAVVDYGTPVVFALTPRHMEDKIPGLTPGFGRADAADGTRFPYIFPIAATYWSQMGAAMKYVKDNGGTKGSKIAYMFFDNPAGREPLGVFERICGVEGYVCRSFALPPPAVEMATQVLDVTRRMKADWVITHIFGKGPSVSIRELRKNGFPMDHVIGFVWGAGEADMIAAGWDTAQGYLGLQFAGVGRDFPVIQEIMQMYKEEGKAIPDYVGSVYYNRGVTWAAVPIEGARLAVEHEGMPLTGEKMRRGLERIRDFSLGGLLPPLTITETDHEGGGWVQLYQTKGEELVPHGEWFQGYRDIVLDEIEKARAKQ